MAGESDHLTANLLSQNLSQLCVPPLFIQSPFFNSHSTDPFFLYPLDVRQVVRSKVQLFTLLLDKHSDA